MLVPSQLAGSAPSGVPQHWHDIDWCRVQQNVRAMQIRIAKACREGNWRRVKALQRMLTRSRSARYLAIRRVTENQGKRTAGVDRVLWDTPDAKWKAANGLKRHGYKPRPSLKTRASARRESTACSGIHPMPNGKRQMG